MKNSLTKFSLSIILSLFMSLMMAQHSFAQSWNLTGNTGTNGATNFIGTTDNVGFKIRTKNVVRIIVSATGNVGIGSTSPTNRLSVSGNANFTGNVGIGITAPTTAKLVISGAPAAQGIDLSTSDQYANMRVLQNTNSSIDKDMYIGYQSGTTSSLHLYSNNLQTISCAAGKVGINQSDPHAQLHLGNLISNRRIILWEGVNNDHQFAGFGMNSNILRYQVEGTSGNHIFYAATSASSSNELMRIQGDGRVSIGSSLAATGYQLTVGGKIICTELKVQVQPFPDYVFAKNYNLKSIDELDQHIKTFNRLPGMPTACEVEENGMNVGDMQTKVVEKVEENTLYIIQLKHEIDALKEELNSLRK